MNILGLDTSTAVSAACLLRADGGSFEAPPAPDRPAQRPGHARELLPAVAAVLAAAGIGWDAVGAVAVGVGPGSFTGLRIGVATARALAVARGLELRPVSSLAALADGARAEAGDAPLLACIDARRGELFAALYSEGAERWPPFAAAPEAVARRLREEGITPLAAGDGSVRFRDVLEAAGARVAPGGSGAHVVRGLSICRLALSVLPLPAEAVLPDYLRRPDAVARQP